MNERKNISDSFLECLLRAYYTEDKTYVAFLINITAIERTVSLFQAYYQNLDKQTHSCHLDIIKKIFADKTTTISTINCQPLLGISYKTYGRYKQQYLLTFKNYLVQHLETTACTDAVAMQRIE